LALHSPQPSPTDPRKASEPMARKPAPTKAHEPEATPADQAFDDPAFYAAVLEAEQQDAWREAWRDALEVLTRLQGGEAVPPVELCSTYDRAVFVRQLCDDPTNNMPESKRGLYRSWWSLIAPILGRALTPECERLGIDPAPLLTAGIAPSMANSIAANAVAERLRLRADQPALPAGADEPAGPALTPSQSRVLQTMARFDPSRLVSASGIALEMDATVRLSEETVRQCVGKLIESQLAERPEGDRSGARLTRAGRKLAGKIAD